MTDTPNYEMLCEASHLTHACALNIQGYFDAEIRDGPMDVIFNTLLPKTFAIVWPLSDLIEQGHLVPSKILLRSLIDRLGTLAWIRKHGHHEFGKWEPGAPHARRPKLDQKIDCFDKFVIGEDGVPYDLSEHINKNWRELLNGATHGDVEDAVSVAPFRQTNDDLLAGPDPNNVAAKEAVSNLATMVLGQLTHEISLALPKAFNQP